MKRKHSQIPTYGTKGESYNYCACVGSTLRSSLTKLERHLISLPYQEW